MEKFDLIVVGGGFTGVSAAVCAARKGMKVLITDENNCFGGAAANCLVNPFMPTSTTNPETNEKIELSRGFFAEILDELKKYDAVDEQGCRFNEEYLKLILNRKLIDAGVKILFHVRLIDVNRTKEKIDSLIFSHESGKIELFADYYVDATGDANLSYLAGCSVQLGRKEDNLCQPMTLCFRVAGVDEKALSKEFKDMNDYYKKLHSEGKLKNPREDILLFHTMHNGILHFNSTRIVKKNPTDVFDVTEAEILSREQVFELFNLLKENFSAFKNSQIISTAMHIGVRESRMIEGEYILTQEDLLECKKFDDAIACTNYDIDIHNPEGSGTSHHFFKPGEYYTIPYRCLIPKGVKNMLVGGRCISSTHEAQASYRIMPVCSNLGEACGLALSQLKGKDEDVRNVDIKQLQSMLISDGAFIGL